VLKSGLVREIANGWMALSVGNNPQKHVWRARIVLLSAEGIGTKEIQRQTGKGNPTIWRWQARFMAEGVYRLLHDATRPAGKAARPAFAESASRPLVTNGELAMSPTRQQRTCC
jgi:hypothetical protein